MNGYIKDYETKKKEAWSARFLLLVIVIALIVVKIINSIEQQDHEQEIELEIQQKTDYFINNYQNVIAELRQKNLLSAQSYLKENSEFLLHSNYDGIKKEIKIKGYAVIVSGNSRTTERLSAINKILKLSPDNSDYLKMKVYYEPIRTKEIINQIENNSVGEWEWLTLLNELIKIHPDNKNYKKQRRKAKEEYKKEQSRVS